MRDGKQPEPAWQVAWAGRPEDRFEDGSGSGPSAMARLRCGRLGHHERGGPARVPERLSKKSCDRCARGDWPGSRCERRPAKQDVRHAGRSKTAERALRRPIHAVPGQCAPLPADPCAPRPGSRPCGPLRITRESSRGRTDHREKGTVRSFHPLPQVTGSPRDVGVPRTLRRCNGRWNGRSPSSPRVAAACRPSIPGRPALVGSQEAVR